jgi:hypothetical protein
MCLLCFALLPRTPSFSNQAGQFEFFGVHNNTLTGVVPQAFAETMACESFINNCWDAGSACGSPRNPLCA